MTRKGRKSQSRRGISISPSLTIHPLKRPSTGEIGTQMEPSEAGPFGRGGARERTEFSPPGGNGGERTLRRRWPPYWKYPPGLFYSNVCQRRRLTLSRRRHRGAGAPPQRWNPWPNSKAFPPDKTVPPSIQGRHAPTPRLVHKPGGGKIGPKLFPVSPTDGRGRVGCWA